MTVKNSIRDCYSELTHFLLAVKIRKSYKSMADSIQAPHLLKEEIREIDANWSKYKVKINYDAFRWYYAVSGIHDWRFIPEDVYAQFILPENNDVHLAGAFSDKNYVDVLFPDSNRPHSLIHNINGIFLDDTYSIIDKETAKAICEKSSKQLFIKPSVDSGKGKKINKGDGKTLSLLLEDYEKDFIVQEEVIQSSFMNELNSSSVNILRVNTFIFDNQVKIICPIVRIGAPGNITDHENIAVGINKEDGSFCSKGVTVSGDRISKLPSGVRFEGKKIPNYGLIVKQVKKWHSQMANIGIIAWDIALGINDEPILIEMNLRYPGIKRCQEVNGPFFGNDTESVLNQYLPKR